MVYPFPLQLFTDASATRGFGAYYNGHWLRGPWLPYQRMYRKAGISITWHELYAIVVAALAWVPSGLDVESCFTVTIRLSSTSGASALPKHPSLCTVFPRIEARASISFQQVFTPASKQDRPVIEAGVYYLMFVEAFVDFQFFVH